MKPIPRWVKLIGGFVFVVGSAALGGGLLLWCWQAMHSKGEPEPSSVLAFSGLLAVVATVWMQQLQMWMQRHELRLQREELQLQRDELKTTRQQHVLGAYVTGMIDKAARYKVSAERGIANGNSSELLMQEYLRVSDDLEALINGMRPLANVYLSKLKVERWQDVLEGAVKNLKHLSHMLKCCTDGQTPDKQMFVRDAMMRNMEWVLAKHDDCKPESAQYLAKKLYRFTDILMKLQAAESAKDREEPLKDILAEIKEAEDVLEADGQK